MRKLFGVAFIISAAEQQLQNSNTKYHLDGGYTENPYARSRFFDAPIERPYTIETDGVRFRADAGIVADGRIHDELYTPDSHFIARPAGEYRLREPYVETVVEPGVIERREAVDLRDGIATQPIRAVYDSVNGRYVDGGNVAYVEARQNYAPIETISQVLPEPIGLGPAPYNPTGSEYRQFPPWTKHKNPKFTDMYCPKPGFTLTHDGDCCREAACESRLECPFEYTLNDHACYKYYEPTIYCPRGQLLEGRCRVVFSEDCLFECPDRTDLDAEGNCYYTEQYPAMEICPPSTIRSKNGCMAVEYTEPALVCPPDTVPEGKKCRREIVTLKMKKGRLLNEVAADEDYEAEGGEYEDYELTPEELEAMAKDVYAFDELYADIAVSPAQECDGSPDCYGEWIPATSEFKIKTRKVKQPIVSEQLKWEKVKIPVTSAKVKDIKVKVPEVKVKAVKEKALKAPHEVVKVITQAAEKICPVGVKHGQTCVAETIVPPIQECPHPQLGPDCKRRIAVPAVPFCKRGELLCDALGCRCETYKDYQPEIVCAGGHDLIDGSCVIKAEYLRMCPIGFFLGGDGYTCIKHDCEPALTVIAKPYTNKKKLPKKFMDAGEDYIEEEE